MRYIVIGVGGVGGSIAARLALSGCDVVDVARGDHLAAIQEQGGLRLRTPAEDVICVCTAVGHVSEVEPAVNEADVVIIATKTHQARVVLDELASAVGSAGDGLAEPPAVFCWCV